MVSFDLVRMWILLILEKPYTLRDNLHESIHVHWGGSILIQKCLTPV